MVPILGIGIAALGMYSVFGYLNLQRNAEDRCWPRNYTQTLQNRSFLVMTYLLPRDCNILPKKDLHLSRWVEYPPKGRNPKWHISADFQASSKLNVKTHSRLPRQAPERPPSKTKKDLPRVEGCIGGVAPLGYDGFALKSPLFRGFRAMKYGLRRAILASLG